MPTRSPKVGLRQPVQAGGKVTGELPWWAKVKPGESMTAAALKELERMQGSKESRQVVGKVNFLL